MNLHATYCMAHHLCGCACEYACNLRTNADYQIYKRQLQPQLHGASHHECQCLLEIVDGGLLLQGMQLYTSGNFMTSISVLLQKCIMTIPRTISGIPIAP